MNEQYENNVQEYNSSQIQPFMLVSDTKPFFDQSDLELTINNSNTPKNKPSVDKASVICAYFICDLPFDC